MVVQNRGGGRGEVLLVVEKGGIRLTMGTSLAQK